MDKGFVVDSRRSTQRIQPLNYYNPRLSNIRESIHHASLYNSVRPTRVGKSIAPDLHPLCTKGKVRQFLFDFTESKSFHVFMLLIILSNTGLIGLQTTPSVQDNIGWYLSLLNIFYLAVYLTEFGLKIGAVSYRYFLDHWNLFDFFIVVTSLVDFIWPMVVTASLTADTDVQRIFRLLKSLRALRALRVIRTIKFLKNLQITVSAIVQSIPALSSIIMLISLVLYIFAIVGKGLYAEVDHSRFGNIGYAAFTLFQLLTLDDWYFIYTDVHASNPETSWHLLIYLIIFIILENFIFINLFIAVIVDNLERAHATAKEEALEKTVSVDSLDSEEVVTAMALDEDQILDEVPPSGATEYYYEGRRDPVIRKIGHYTELLATMEYYVAENQPCIRSLNKLMAMAMKSHH